MQRLLGEAVQAFRGGNFAGAEQLCLNALKLDVRCAEALHLLGYIGNSTGRFELGVRMIGRAIAVDPNQPHFHSNLGIALQSLGRLDEAVGCYRRALALKPDFAEAHFNLAIALEAQGKLDQALASYLQVTAIKPDHAQAHFSAAVALQTLGRLDEAVAGYQRSLTLKPENAEAQTNLANVWSLQGKLDDAVAGYGRALTLKPHLAEAHSNLGNALKAQGKLERAVACYRRALALKPEFVEAHSNLGNALKALGLLDEAVACYGRALALDAGFADAHFNLGNTQMEQDRLVDAEASYRRALELKPEFAEAEFNLGNALRDQGRVDEAAACFDRALALQPDYADAHWNRALAQLLLGDFEAGWRNFEWRRSQQAAPHTFAQPQWRGEPLRVGGKPARILLHAEQGLGDNVQFLRYVPLVQAAGGEVILSLPASLRRMAALLPGIAALVTSWDELPAFDFHCPLMSLPLAFGTTQDTIPAAVPYLPVPQEARKAAAALEWPPGLRVGLVWAGNPDHTNDRNRSMQLSQFEPLLGLERVSFFSLQMGKAVEEIAAFKVAISDLASGNSDMAETAAQIEHLDLIVAVDTAVAHLAGALGKPVWLLLPFTPDWRWMREREDSPWYPAMRLFRQPKPGDWQTVIGRVRAELCTLAEGRCTPPAALAAKPGLDRGAANSAADAPAAAFPYRLTRTRHGVMLANCNDIYMGQSFLKYGECSEHEVELLLKYIERPGEVIEVGANMGVHTVPLARQLARRGRSMMVFEPQRVVFQQLCANLALNGLMNVRAFQAACGKERGEVSFPAPDYRRQGNFGRVAMALLPAPLTETDRAETVTVPCHALDELVPAAHVALIKIDVEGFERQVLEGARGIMVRSRPVLYVENDRPAQSRALTEWLFAQGYRLWWHITRAYNPGNFLGDKENIYGQTAFFNMLCLHSECLDRDGLDRDGLDRDGLAAPDGLPEITDASAHPLA
jgi:FkbM family methyltransferase